MQIPRVEVAGPNPVIREINPHFRTQRNLYYCSPPVARFSFNHDAASRNLQANHLMGSDDLHLLMNEAIALDQAFANWQETQAKYFRCGGREKVSRKSLAAAPPGSRATALTSEIPPTHFYRSSTTSKIPPTKSQCYRKTSWSPMRKLI